MYPAESLPTDIPRLPTDRQMSGMSYVDLRSLHTKFTRYSMHLLVKLGKAKAAYTNYRELQDKTVLALRGEIRRNEPDTDASTRKEMIGEDDRLLDVDSAVMRTRSEEEFFNGQSKAADRALRNIEEHLYSHTRRGPQIPTAPSGGSDPTNPANPGGRRIRKRS